MSQFHIDFDLDGACGDIYSIESYFLAKKVYIDILESVDKDGNTIQGNHIRLKSVPNSCIQHIAGEDGVACAIMIGGWMQVGANLFAGSRVCVAAYRHNSLV